MKYLKFQKVIIYVNGENSAQCWSSWAIAITKGIGCVKIAQTYSLQ